MPASPAVVDRLVVALRIAVDVSLVAALLLVAAPLRGQQPEDAPAAEREVPPLFASDDELPVTFTADFEQLDHDRRESPDRPGVLTVAGPDGAPVQIRMRIRTRGEFRLDPVNCDFPPLRIDVRSGDAEGTVFDGQDDLKVVSSCRPGRDHYDHLVPIEYLAYRAYRLVTDYSFMVRPLRVTFVDTSGENETETRYAFLIEDADALAERIGGLEYELPENQNLPSTAFEPSTQMMTAVFQYMIGNTDWGDVAGHNVELIDRNGVAFAVPYDFDYSGLVDARYAVPAPNLGLDDVTERRYRGWCQNPIVTRSVLQRFRDTSASVLALFESYEELDDGSRDRTLRYLRRFYDEIETDDRANRRFLRDCRTPGA